jgi:multiple sugar transport system permease protein/raffinose/stachyose/melibiose transport system permease protein
LLPALRSRPWGAILEFTAPALLLYASFTIVPLMLTFFNSVHVLRMQAGMQLEFVGLQHYIDLITKDSTFHTAVQNSTIWALVSPWLEIPLAFVLAYIVSRKIPLGRFFRIAWFLPVLISWVVTGAIFRWVFNYDWGVVNVVLNNVGLGFLAQNWLGNPATALPALIAVTTWKWIGWNFVILLAALSSIPEDLLDAARIDGANDRRVIWNVILPLLRPILVNLMILCFIGKMKVFDLVWIMTRGGPLGRTETVSTYVQRRAFEWNTLDLGYPSAMAVLWFVVVFGGWLVFTRVFRSRESLEF